MNKTLLTELFEKPNAEFSKHISDPQNVRILFSGKFGIGKTTFINQYFAGKEDGYIKIHLYPVNYSIASNEDIIDLIKYDILMELIREGAEFTCEDISKVDAIVGFTKENSIEVVKALIGCIPKIGKEVNAAYNGLENIGKSFDEYYKGKKNDEGDTTNDFANLIKNGKGLIYENSAITSIICNKIDQLAKEKKKVVLVIDDLDRIDPDHIFRLFNVFAAHFDSTDGDSSSNKFGFDKVIFVCDVDNIRSIFKHRYGVATDFGGYIDKFFSREVFEFDNILNAAEITEKIVSNIEFKYKEGNISSRFNSTHNIVQEIEAILSDYMHFLILLRIINTRKLTNYYKNRLEIDISQNIHLNKSMRKNISELPFLCACKVLKCLWGEDEELLQTLNKYSSDLMLHNLDTFSNLLEKASETIYIYQTKEVPEERFLIMLNNQRVEFNSNDRTSYEIIHPADVPRTNVNILELLKQGIEFLKILELHNYKHLN